jgi:hypothetical protein
MSKTQIKDSRGRKSLPPQEKKKALTVYIPEKYLEQAKPMVEKAVKRFLK